MKLKDKIIAVVLCLLTALFCVAGLTACDDTEEACSHEWGKWKVTAEPTCGKAGSRERVCVKCDESETEPIAALNHTPNSDDGDCTTPILCATCEAVITEAKAAHTGGTATCTEKAKCEACGKEYGELLAHIPAEDDGDCTTAILCTVCETVTTEAKEAHTGGTATCTEKAKCEACGKEYGELLAHIPAEDDGDCTTAIICAVCGDTIAAAGEAHVGGTATCKERARCSSCGKEYGDFAPHIPAEDDGDCTTAILCTVCDKVTTEAKAAHTGGTATCKELAKCDTCGKEYGELLAHIPAEDDGDCTTAILCTVCEKIMTEAKAAHTGGTATCKELAKCETCGKEYGDYAAHIPAADDGDCTTAILCTVCEKIMTEAKAAHIGGTATCKELAKCETCGKGYGDYAAHKGEITWIKLLDSHYLVYSCCYARMSEPQPHSMSGGACTECGFKPTVSSTAPAVTPGDTRIEVSVSLADNPGITGMQLTLEYNSDALTLVDAKSGDALSALTFTAPGEFGSGCKFLWDGVEVTEEDMKSGEFLILTFDVSEDAPIGDLSILFKVVAYDNDLNRIDLVIEGGKITVLNP